jgi:hypothetical protein
MRALKAVIDGKECEVYLKSDVDGVLGAFPETADVRKALSGIGRDLDRYDDDKKVLDSLGGEIDRRIAEYREATGISEARGRMHRVRNEREQRELRKVMATVEEENRRLKEIMGRYRVALCQEGPLSPAMADELFELVWNFVMSAKHRLVRLRYFYKRVMAHPRLGEIRKAARDEWDIYVTTGALPAYERLERDTDFVTADVCSVFNRLHQLMFRILDKEMRKFGESEGDSRT